MPPGVVPAIGSVDKKGAAAVPAVAIVVTVAGMDPWRGGVVGRGVRVGWYIRIVGRRISLNRRSRFRRVVVALNDALAHHRRRRWAFDHNIAFAIDRPI